MATPGNVRRPGCESCRASNTDGNRGDPQYEFPETQKWCRVSGKRIRFIDETADINSIHNEDFESDDEIVSDEEPPPSPPRQPQRLQRQSSNRAFVTHHDNVSLSNNFTAGSPLPVDRGTPHPVTRLPALHPHPSYDSPGSTAQLSIDDPPRPYSPVPRSQLSGPIGCISSIGSGSLSEDPAIPEPRRSFHAANFPLKDHREAALVRHFLDFIAPPFDYGDPHNRFTTLLPQHAAMSPLLLNAVLAVSAKSKDEDTTLAFFDKPAEHYYEAALDLLKPVLTNPNADVDDLHVTSAVLLRLYHSISVPDMIPNPPTLPPSCVWDFLTTRAKFTTKGSLAEAAFWGWMRLEIFRAVMQQDTPDIQLGHLDLDRSLQPADDETWAWRMVLHTIDIIIYCFGDAGTPTTYEKLSAYAAQWMRAVPSTFSPVFVENPPDEGVFPEILLINDSVVVGLQFYHLNRILLTAHNPNVPRLGKNQKLAARTLDSEITSDIKIMCGIAESLGRCTPAHVIACMGIALAGDRVTSYSDQEALCKVFASTADAFAWDTALMAMSNWFNFDSLQHLKDAWGWPEEMISD
ncbi:hypothetical protein CkaCkLH20_09540 [Colletotrichum karsti]|uniref:Arca-like protein n=1 Tax=Colletotrichum karsti TaxID=1095194 RepID=A0A9P6LHX3_9PEZI|nr:uncharacterized protein CkaCkLH20_09540 [Colletotrichum karsti]KAF9873030.1 hypothetical protein CkaCkLH20_09540 [Colletotrichum karsti]